MVKVRKGVEDALQSALVQLAQAEATLVANQAAFVAQLSQTKHESDERFQRIESILLRLLEVIPDALREKIGLQKK
jgi:hypothetical protein